MSNASNLSTLANVLDDGSDGQFLKSTGSGGVAFDTVAAGAVVYATADLLPLSGFAAGDMAYVTATNRFYINNGSGWYSISLVNTNPNITSVADASSGTTPFTLATDQTATVITITAADPEGVPLTYGYSVTSGSLNGSTVAQGTGNNTNVFTVTPHASQDATFTLTFTASDGINQATSANEFSLTFITTVADSNHTTLLATATGTSDNNNITDSSSNSHSITVNGDAYAGTFSPYRSGGYSTHFTGSAGDRLEVGNQSGNWSDTGTVTIEFWFYSTRTPSTDEGDGLGAFFTPNVQSVTATRFDIENSSNDLEFRSFSDAAGNGFQTVTIKSALTPHNWYHLAAVKNGQVWKFYVNGVLEHTHTQSTTYNWSGYGSGNYNKHFIGQTRDAVSFQGYITDIRVSSNQAYTTAFTPPAERLEADSNTTFFYSGTGYIGDTHSSTASNNESITVNGDVSTKPFSPYDYEEYDAADNGGSVYFVGGADYSSQYLSLSGPSMPSGDFTLSMWAYLTHTVNDNKTLFDFNGNSDGFRITYRSNTNGGYHFRFYTAGGSVYLYDQNVSHYLNQWYYIVVIRDSGTFKLYVNNVLIGTSTANLTFSSSNNIRIGQAIGGSGTVEGYLSDIIYNPTTAITDFTPPTAPLSSSGAALHIKGTDASIIDKSQGANLKLVGSTTGSTTQVKFANTKSMYFDASGDYISISDNEAYGFGTDDWTIETWLYCTKTGGFNAIFDTRVGTGTEAGSFGLGMHTTGRVQMYSNATSPAQFLYPSSTLSFNTWQHLAVVKNSGTTTMYFNGTAASLTYSDSRNYGSSQPVQIGKDDTTSNYFGGYMQDFRITKGLARYTGNFTPPSASLEG